MKRVLWIGGLVLALCGIGLTLFLTWAHFNGALGNICGSGSNCQTVLTSSYATFGGLPTALYGLLFYVFVFGTILVYPVADSRGRGFLMNGLLGLSTTAFVISLALMGYSLGTLHSFCLYCGTSFALITVIFLGSVFWKVRGGRKEEFLVDSVSGWQALSTVIAIVAVLLAGLSVFFYQQAPNPEENASIKREAKVLAYDARSVGSPSAPIRVVEFFDLECPACQQFSSRVFPKIKEQYIDTGKVLWTFRYFPLDQHHPHALEAHAALSLIPPNKFLEAKTRIMRNANQWVSRRVSDPTPYLRSVLSDYGIENPPVTKQLKQSILDRRDVYQRMGIGQTPSFFVNGELVAGGRPISFWQKLFSRLSENN